MLSSLLLNDGEASQGSGLGTSLARFPQLRAVMDALEAPTLDTSDNPYCVSGLRWRESLYIFVKFTDVSADLMKNYASFIQTANNSQKDFPLIIATSENSTPPFRWSQLL